MDKTSRNKQQHDYNTKSTITLFGLLGQEVIPVSYSPGCWYSRCREATYTSSATTTRIPPTLLMAHSHIMFTHRSQHYLFRHNTVGPSRFTGWIALPRKASKLQVRPECFILRPAFQKWLLVTLWIQELMSRSKHATRHAMLPFVLQSFYENTTNECTRIVEARRTTARQFHSLPLRKQRIEISTVRTSAASEMAVSQNQLKQYSYCSTCAFVLFLQPYSYCSTSAFVLFLQPFTLTYTGNLLVVYLWLFWSCLARLGGRSCNVP